MTIGIPRPSVEDDAGRNRRSTTVSRRGRLARWISHRDKVEHPMKTDETVESLVEQLANAGTWPEPRLLAAILERGSEAVGPLRALIRRDFEDETAQAAVSFAVELLGSFGDVFAVPDLLELLRRYDDLDILEAVRPALRMLKAPVIEPALEIARDRSLGSYPRDTAVHIAMEAAGDDLVARAGVAQALRDMLADYLGRGDEAEEDDVEMATWLVNALADLADPLARELIDAAFQADMVDGWIISPKDVEQSYLEGGRRLDSEPRLWLPRYESQYADHLKWQRRRDEPKPAQPLYEPPLPVQPGPIPPAETTIRNTAPRPGRNDPCWCGSGKKYKKCHLLQDQG
jgi:SEC-C motif-containing protein